MVITFPGKPADSAYRNEIRVWMRQVMAQRNWTPEHWARECGMAGTTIRRFLNGGEEAPSPSLDTLGRLIKVAGFGPTIDLVGSRSKSSVEQVPLLHIDLVATLVSRAAYHDAGRDILNATKVAISRGDYSSLAYATVVDHNSCNQIGIYTGDIVICEPVWSLNPGSADLVLIEDLGQVMPMTYHSPLLIPRSADIGYNPRPQDEVHMLATVVEVRRRLRRK